MSNKHKHKLTTHDYLMATKVASADSYVDPSGTLLVHPDISPEAKVIKRDCYDKLSNEAKELMHTVTNRPIAFVKFAWNNDQRFAANQLPKKTRRIKRTNSKDYPYRLPRKQNKTLENRLTNLDVIKLFFKYKWKKDVKFINNVIEEIVGFVGVLK